MGAVRFAVVAGLCLGVCGACSSSSSGSSSGSLVGTWDRAVDAGNDSAPVSVSFLEDHTFTEDLMSLGTETGQWSISGGFLMLTCDASSFCSSPGTLKLNYAISGNTLTWTFAGGTTWSFQRQP